MIYHPMPAQTNLEPKEPNRPDSKQPGLDSVVVKPLPPSLSSLCCPRYAPADLGLPGKIPGETELKESSRPSRLLN